MALTRALAQVSSRKQAAGASVLAKIEKIEALLQEIHSRRALGMPSDGCVANLLRAAVRLRSDVALEQELQRLEELLSDERR